jgi:hypothetical protein
MCRPTYRILSKGTLGHMDLSATTGDNRAAQPLAEQFSRVARRAGDSADILVGDRLMGNVMHFRGNQLEARQYLQRVLDLYGAPSNQRHSMWFHHDQRLLAQVMLARVLWVQGFIDQAKRMAQASLEYAEATDHKMSDCYVLGEAVCPIALMTDAHAAAERRVAMLSDLIAEHSVTVYESLKPCLEGVLLIKRGEFAAGCGMLRTALDTFGTTGFTQKSVSRTTRHTATPSFALARLAQVSFYLPTSE